LEIWYHQEGGLVERERQVCCGELLIGVDAEASLEAEFGKKDRKFLGLFNRGSGRFGIYLVGKEVSGAQFRGYLEF
jgi:hypothetical protein